MKLCFICNEYPPGPHGGVGTLTQVLARALKRAGHDVRVTGLYPRNYPAADYEEDEGIPVWRLRYPDYKFGWIVARRRMYRMIRDWVNQGAVELIEAPDSRGWFAGWPRMSVPLVQRANGSFTFFADDTGVPVKPMVNYLEKKSYKRTDVWVSVSQYTAQRTESLFGLQAKPAQAVLYNPIVQIPSITPLGDRTGRDVVFTGTLTKKKGVLPLMRAWRDVHCRQPDAHLHIYGKDTRTSEGESVLELMRDLIDDSSSSSVTFHGHVDRSVLNRALSTARVAVFPSFSEAFGIAPIEAMACGCPTIYSTLGPGPEVVRHDRDGLLVDPNHSAEIADEILRLLKDNSLAERLSEAGPKAIAERFGIDKLVRENEAFYRSTIASFSGSRLPNLKSEKQADLREHQAL